ncbi:Mss4-like protein [Tuber brumale]|nr:Mss4-like protein [Tuber brumale]
MRPLIAGTRILRNISTNLATHIHKYKAAIPRPLPHPFLLNAPTRLMGSSFSTSTTNQPNSKMSTSTSLPVQKSDDEWRAILSPEQFRVLRTRGTEPPNSGTYNHHTSPGVYTCVGCSAPLYTSTSKFDSGCGWPAFFEGVPGAINRREDGSLGMRRTEIICANCGGHLGHVFKGEGFGGAADERHCVNSVSLKFKGE